MASRTLQLMYEFDKECALLGYDYEKLPAHVKLTIGVIREIVEHEIPGLCVHVHSLSGLLSAVIPLSLAADRIAPEIVIRRVRSRWTGTTYSTLD